MKRLLTLALAASWVVVGSLAAIAPRSSAAEPKRQLVLAFIPQENPEKLIGDIKAITDYLSKETGIPVKGFVAQDHAAAVEALRNEQADVSFMGGMPYVLAHAHAGAEVVLGEVYRGSATYRGRIFVRKDSGITSIDQLRGKSIAFADPISESGYIYPLDIFVRAGHLTAQQDPHKFFGAVYFAGGYQQAMQAMVNGHVDAAGASQYADLLLSASQYQEVKWIAESKIIPSHAVVVRKGLKPALVEAFKRAMLQLNEPAYRHLLQHVYNPDGYVETNHAKYASVEKMARQYGFLKAESKP